MQQPTQSCKSDDPVNPASDSYAGSATNTGILRVVRPWYSA